MCFMLEKRVAPSYGVSWVMVQVRLIRSVGSVSASPPGLQQGQNVSIESHFYS